MPNEHHQARPPAFYRRDGREIRIERIYNRVIFDELLRRPELRPGFDFREDLDVIWVGHPNWYFRISKFLPVPEDGAHFAGVFFADEFPPNESLEDYVLKPLYSFAGLGVEMEPTRRNYPPCLSRMNGLCNAK